MTSKMPRVLFGASEGRASRLLIKHLQVGVHQRPERQRRVRALAVAGAPGSDSCSLHCSGAAMSDTTASPGRRLRQAWATETIALPGVFDALVARMAERL